MVKKPTLQELQSEIERLRELAATCYAGLGDECNLPVEWLDVLNQAANGEVFSVVNLLPFRRSQIEFTPGLPSLTQGPCIFLMWDGMLCEGVLHHDGEHMMLTHYNLSAPGIPEKITMRADTGKVQAYAPLTGHHRAVTS